jgi:hypothetical protein
LYYLGVLVLIGCTLAIKTRNLDPRFGEAKQLAFAMYNIAFTGIVIIVVLNLVELEYSIKVILHAAGVCWGTVFSSFAFVLPRLLAIKKDNKAVTHASKRFTMQGGNQVLVSRNLLGGISGLSSDFQKSSDFRSSGVSGPFVAGHSLEHVSEGHASSGEMVYNDSEADPEECKPEQVTSSPGAEEAARGKKEIR